MSEPQSVSEETPVPLHSTPTTEEAACEPLQSKPKRTRKPSKVGAIPAGAPTQAELAKQVEVPSDEDVPPPNKKRYSEKYIEEDVQDSQANRDMRQQYAGKAYGLAWDSITFLFALVAGNAVWAAISGKQVISDQLLFALITGVTVNVLAAFLGVIRGLFPSENKKPKRGKR